MAEGGEESEPPAARRPGARSSHDGAEDQIQRHHQQQVNVKKSIAKSTTSFLGVFALSLSSKRHPSPSASASSSYSTSSSSSSQHQRKRKRTPAVLAAAASSSSSHKLTSESSASATQPAHHLHQDGSSREDPTTADIHVQNIAPHASTSKLPSITSTSTTTSSSFLISTNTSHALPHGQKHTESATSAHRSINTVDRKGKGRMSVQPMIEIPVVVKARSQSRTPSLHLSSRSFASESGFAVMVPDVISAAEDKQDATTPHSDHHHRHHHHHSREDAEDQDPLRMPEVSSKRPNHSSFATMSSSTREGGRQHDNEVTSSAQERYAGREAEDQQEEARSNIAEDQSIHDNETSPSSAMSVHDTSATSSSLSSSSETADSSSSSESVESFFQTGEALVDSTTKDSREDLAAQIDPNDDEDLESEDAAGSPEAENLSREESMELEEQPPRMNSQSSGTGTSPADQMTGSDVSSRSRSVPTTTKKRSNARKRPASEDEYEVSSDTLDEDDIVVEEAIGRRRSVRPVETTSEEVRKLTQQAFVLAGFGSSPLTPLRGSPQAPPRTTASIARPSLLSAARKQDTSPVAGSTGVGGDGNISPDFSDEDADVPLRRLRSPSQRIAPKASTSRLPPEPQPRAQPELRRTRRVLAPKSSMVAVRMPVEAPQAGPSGPAQNSSTRGFYTRSRTAGAAPNCLQCHRCETYQTKSLMLACMTCERSICAICFAAYYSDHPSYAATVAFLKVQKMASSGPSEGLHAPPDDRASSATRTGQAAPPDDVAFEGTSTSISAAPVPTVDLSGLDFRCPVCKALCRCPTCLRGPVPRDVQSIPQAPPPIKVVPAPSYTRSPATATRTRSLRRAASTLSSDEDYQPIQASPRLNRGTTTRPNLRVSLRPTRGRPPSKLSKAGQRLARSSSSNAYYDLQDAIAGEAARRAMIDAETEYVPVVASRQPRAAQTQSPESRSAQQSSETSDSEEAEAVEVTSRPRRGPAVSARVRLATTVGQQLGKSPAYVEARRSPRREGDQLIPYNDREPVLTLAPDHLVEYHDPDHALSESNSGRFCFNDENSEDPAPPWQAPATQTTTETDEVSNELLASLLELPDLSPNSQHASLHTQHQDEFIATDADHLSPSDTLTSSSTASVVSVTSPSANDTAIAMAVSGLTAIGLSNNLPSKQSLFSRNNDIDGDFLTASPSSTPKTRSMFLQNHLGGLATPPSSSAQLPTDGLFANYLHGSPSRHTPFDVDLMSDWSLDRLIQA